jgi:hypothetical protein
VGRSVASEHGLGRAKVALANQPCKPLERALMALLKSALDETGVIVAYRELVAR